MSCWLEFHVAGGGCAVIEVSAIAGFQRNGHDLFAPGTPAEPVQVIMRAGATVEVVGESVGALVTRLISAKHKEKTTPGAIAHFDRLTPLEPDDAAGAGPVEV